MRASYLVVWIDEPVWCGERHEIRVRGLHSARRLARVVAGFVVDASGALVADCTEAA